MDASEISNIFHQFKELEAAAAERAVYRCEQAVLLAGKVDSYGVQEINHEGIVYEMLAKSGRVVSVTVSYIDMAMSEESFKYHIKLERMDAERVGSTTNQRNYRHHLWRSSKT